MVRAEIMAKVSKVFFLTCMKEVLPPYLNSFSRNEQPAKLEIAKLNTR